MLPTLDEEKLLAPQSQEELKDVLGTAPYLVAGCMDLRYCLKQRHPVRSKCGVHKFDLIAWAGCVHMLAEPKGVLSGPSFEIVKLYDAAKVIAEYSIMLGITYHKVGQILLSTHQGCGHVGREGYLFSSAEEEEKKHATDRREAAEWVHDKFPSLKIWTCFSYLDSDNFVQIKNLLMEEF